MSFTMLHFSESVGLALFILSSVLATVLSHVYRARTSSSQRTRAGAIAMESTRAEIARETPTKRSKKRKLKIGNFIDDVEPSPEHSLSLEELRLGLHVFSGDEGSDLELPSGIPPTLKSIIQTHSIGVDLRVVRPTSHTLGHQMNQDGDNVFFQPPRNTMLRVQGKNARKNNNAAMEGALKKHASTSRSQSRLHFHESNAYVTIGAQPQRGKAGVQQTNYNTVPASSIGKLSDLFGQAERLAEEWCGDLMYALRAAKEAVPWKTFESTRGRANYWSAIAIAYNYFSAAHVDEDFFLSVFAVNAEHPSEHASTQEEAGYDPDAPIATYICFPNHGVAVAMRPGDFLFFNPLKYHCCSTKTSAYEDAKVYCSSIYLKTAVVGGNDNNTPLTETQELILESGEHLL